MNKIWQVKALSMALLLWVVAIPAWAGLTVELRETVYVPGGYVQLYEVATVRGDTELRTEAGRMYLGPAPERGGLRLITRKEIRERLEETGIPGPVQFAGAMRVSVHTREEDPGAGGDVSAASPTQAALPDPDALIKDAFTRHVKKHYARTDIRLATTVDRIEGDLPAASECVKVVEILSGRIPGRARVRLQAAGADGRALAMFEAQVLVTAHVPVLMVRRPIKTNEMLSKDDLMVRRASLRQNVVYLPADLSRFVGKAAAKPLRGNVPLQLGDLTEALAVRKGQFVKVDTLAGGFRIRTHARAGKDARVGDLLMVENLNPKQCTRKSFPARVTGTNQVEVLQIKGR